MSPPFVPSAALSVILLLLAFGTVTLAKNAPPELLPLEGAQSPIRIATGTRGFKLSCPVRVDSEEGAAPGEELIIKWSKDGQPLAPNADDRFRLANGDRDLRIRQAQQSDSGLYRCTAINEWGHRSVDFRLEVLDPRGLVDGVRLVETASAPAWKVPLGPQPIQKRVRAGQLLELRCPEASANPLPHVVWLRRGHQEQEVGHTTQLVFTKIRPQDAGIYACRLSNSLGAIRADFSVQVTEEMDAAGSESILLGPSGSLSPASPPLAALPAPPAPRIEQPQMLKAGSTAQLLCRVEWRGEKDQAVIRWLRQLESAEADALRFRAPNATLLRLGDISLLMLDQGSDAVRVEADAQGQRHFVNELRIANVRKEDSGRYFCVVTNPAGQFVYRSALLSVVDTPTLNFLPFPMSPAFRLALLAGLALLLCCFPLASWLLCARHCRARANQTEKCHPASYSANNTFASSSSGSTGSSAQKAALSPGADGGNQLPPLPRLPPPQLPPSTSFSTPQVVRQVAHHGGGTYWPAQTLERPSMLHRTSRAEDELSRISSHIYASGSPLPPSHHPQHPAAMYPTNYASQTLQHVQHQQRMPPQTVSMKMGRNLERRGRGRLAGEEQKMPLIEAQRQSTELWRGN